MNLPQRTNELESKQNLMNPLTWLPRKTAQYKKEFLGFSSEALSFNETVLIYKRLDAMLVG